MRTVIAAMGWPRAADPASDEKLVGAAYLPLVSLCSVPLCSVAGARSAGFVLCHAPAQPDDDDDGATGREHKSGEGDVEDAGELA